MEKLHSDRTIRDRQAYYIRIIFRPETDPPSILPAFGPFLSHLNSAVINKNCFLADLSGFCHCSGSCRRALNPVVA
jgi:hypothetical protein